MFNVWNFFASLVASKQANTGLCASGGVATAAENGSELHRTFNIHSDDLRHAEECARMANDIRSRQKAADNPAPATKSIFCWFFDLETETEEDCLRILTESPEFIEYIDDEDVFNRIFVALEDKHICKFGVNAIERRAKATRQKLLEDLAEPQMQGVTGAATAVRSREKRRV